MGIKIAFQFITWFHVCHSFNVFGLHLLESTAGSDVELTCPCRTKFGSFSKVDEKATIWTNGIIASSKRARFSYAGGNIVLSGSLPSDSGDYVWVCDREYSETVVRLTVRDTTKTCHESKVGLDVAFPCPCRTGVGSFSRSTEKGTIWSNGIVAKDLRGRISYENKSMIIQHVVPEDEGEYVWVCDESYSESRVCLKIEDTIELKNNYLDIFETHFNQRSVIFIASLTVGALFGFTICLVVGICFHRRQALKGRRYNLNVFDSSIVRQVGFIKSKQGRYKHISEEIDPFPDSWKPIYKLSTGKQTVPTSQLLVSSSIFDSLT